MTQVYTETQPQEEYAGDDLAAQQAAREAVLLLDIFELERGLIGVFGPTAETFFVRQLCYWYRRPKMRGRWWIYKTLAEWREEMNLNRKQVDRARRRLKPFGVIEEKFGPYRRIHYRLDWVRLAELLSLPLKGVQMDGEGDGALLTPLKGAQTVIDPPLGGYRLFRPPPNGRYARYLRRKPSKRGVQSNTEDYTEDYLHKIPLTGGADDSSSRHAPPMGGDKVKVEGYDHGTPPDEDVTQLDKRHASTIRNPEERAAGEGMVGASPSGDATPEQLVTEAQRLLFGQGIDPQTATVNQAVEAIEESLDKMLSAKQQKQFGSEWRRRQKAAAPPPPPPKLDPSKDRQYRKVLDLVLDPEREVGRIALDVIRGEEDREELVGAVGRALGDPLGGMQYRARITQAVGELEELRRDVPAERLGVAM